MGSVFSPYYAWAGRRAPLDHCALNVCLYGPGVRRWAMTERRAGEVEAGEDHVRLGPSAVRFEDGALIYDIAEYGAPVPLRVRGQVVIRPEAEQSETFTLDAAGRHVWRPIWPRARVEARFTAPDLRFSGEAYVDMNAGEEPLEAGFRSWNWARTALPDGAAILYDSVWKDGGGQGLALRIGPDGKAAAFDPPPLKDLPLTGWRVARAARSEGSAQVQQTLEDTPFYARSLISTELLGAPRKSMHESLDLTRFSSPVVKMMLPFRMPRAFWR
ncbi:hypothetical protein [Alkalicaulis satelles]|uniref:hypothetical protein n=1 Tax=Alkalicaulis satelles TaxID=2609175 RepID=UPI001E2E8E3F|nr:hypothetical protein [Alkalicaulis satelles]